VGRRRGRRDNGLDASDYVAVADLDPRVGEHLLDVLGAHGIAAYLQPSMDVNPITRNSTVPDRPVDRLYADRSHVSDARDLLRRLTAEGNDGDSADPVTPDPHRSGHDAAPPPEVIDTRTGPDPSPATFTHFDATFAGIVADFDRPVDPTSAAWPSAENLAEPPSPPVAPAGQGPVDARHLVEASLLGSLYAGGDPGGPGPDADVDTMGEGRFVPPPPPPLPRLSRQALLGGLAVVVGLALVLAPQAGPFQRTESILLGFAAIFGGAVALILRLRPGTDPDDRPPGDGAQV
jgi:hypothetical protein